MNRHQLTSKFVIDTDLGDLWALWQDCINGSNRDTRSVGIFDAWHDAVYVNRHNHEAIHAFSDVGFDSICLLGRVVVCIKNE